MPLDRIRIPLTRVGSHAASLATMICCAVFWITITLWIERQIPTVIIHNGAVGDATNVLITIGTGGTKQIVRKLDKLAFKEGTEIKGSLPNKKITVTSLSFQLNNHTYTGKNLVVLESGNVLIVNILSHDSVQLLTARSQLYSPTPWVLAMIASLLLWYLVYRLELAMKRHDHEVSLSLRTEG